MRTRPTVRFAGSTRSAVALLASVAALSVGCDPAPQGASGGSADDPAAVYTRAEALASRHRVSEAIATIEAYAQDRSGPLSSDAERALYERWADLLLRASRPDDAARALARIAATARLERRDLRARVASACGRYDEALRWFARLPDSDRLRSPGAFADTALQGGRPRLAAALAATELARDPWLDETTLVFGRALARCGQKEAAGAFLERYRRGESFRNALDLAVELEFHGRDVAARLQRAKAEHARGRWFESMKLANDALELDRNAGAAYVHLAELSTQLARPADAIRVLERLPPHARKWLALGKAYEANDDRERAKHAYEEAAELDDQLTEAADGLSRLESPSTASALDGTRRAVRDATAGKSLSTTTPELRRLADAYAVASRDFEARGIALLTVRLQPGDTALRRWATRHFSAPSDAFVRVWLLSPVDTRSTATELAALGVDVTELKALPALAASPVGEPGR